MLVMRSQALFGERRETGDFISGCESPGRKKGGALGMRDLTQPNGPAFSLDGEHFYVDNSQGKNIRVYDVTPVGNLANSRIFGDEKGEPHDGVPNGIKVDQQGDLFVMGAQGIWVWDAQGHHLATIVIPGQPTNLAWADKDYRTLYNTATMSVYCTKLREFVPY